MGSYWAEEYGTSQFTRGSKQLRTCILFKCIDFRLLVTFFNLFVFHLQVNVVGALLLNTSLLPDSWYCRLITVTDQCRSLNLLTTENDGVFWVLTDYWLFVRLMPRLLFPNVCVHCSHRWFVKYFPALEFLHICLLLLLFSILAFYSTCNFSAI